MITNALRSGLRQLVSHDNVIDDAASLGLYGADGSGQCATPGLVVVPGTEGEMAAVVRLLAAEGESITIRGSATGVTGGAVPQPGGVVVSTARLNEPVRLIPSEDTVVAPAGARMHDVERIVQPAGLTLGGPLDDFPSGTFGGAIARNGDGTGGPAGTLHGKVRSLRAVLRDGTMFEAEHSGPHGLTLEGGSLIVGSEGGIAIVTQASLALDRQMPCHRVVMAAFDSIVMATQAGAGLIASGASPIIADAVDLATWIRLAPWPTVETADGLLLVWLSGLEEDVDDEAMWTAGICSDYSAQQTSVLNEAALARVVPVWSRLIRESRPLPSQTPIDIAVPCARLPELLDLLYVNAQEQGILPTGVVRVASGALAMRIPTFDGNGEDDARAKRLVGTLTDHAHEFQGMSMALHGIGKQRVRLLETTHQSSDLEVFRLVKHSFDPRGVFAAPLAPILGKEDDRRDHDERISQESRIGKIHTALTDQIEEAMDADEHLQIGAPSADALTQIFRIASRLKTPLAIHDIPDDRALDVQLSEMNRLVMFDGDNRSIVVEGGMRLRTVQEHAASAGLWWPISPLVSSETCVSDVLAWNRSDPRSLGCGLIADHVIGTEAVAARGDVFSWGSLVHMQHAGPRAADLCLGARNRYAVLTAAAIQLSPRPSACGCVSGVFEDTLSADRAMRRWLARDGSNAALGARPTAAWAVAGREPDDPSAVRAFIEFTGTPSSVERQAETLAEIASESEGQTVTKLLDDEAEPAWDSAAEIHRGLPVRSADGTLYLVVWTTCSRWAHVAQKIQVVLRAMEHPCRLLMDFGTGRLDIAVDNAAAEPAPVIGALREPVLRARATMEVWSSPMVGGWVGAIPPGNKGLLSKLKSRFDPDRILPDGWGAQIELERRPAADASEDLPQAEI